MERVRVVLEVDAQPIIFSKRSQIEEDCVQLVGGLIQKAYDHDWLESLCGDAVDSIEIVEVHLEGESCH